MSSKKAQRAGVLGIVPAVWGMLLTCLLLGPPAPLRAQGGASIKVLESSASFPTLSAHIEVCDMYGRSLAGLGPQQFSIVEDGRPIPTGAITLSEQAPSEQRAPGPVLGIVLDLSELLGIGQIEAARDAAIALLQTGGALSAAGPELASLFIPARNAGQPSQVAEFASFTHDHNALINYLNASLAPHSGATRLYHAVDEAVESVAARAVQRGTPGYVVILSDGQDSLSASSFAPALASARARQIAIITFSFGVASERGAQHLRQLAGATGGEHLEHPTPQQASALYRRIATPAPRGSYRISYTSPLAADDQPHAWQIYALVDGREIVSARLQFASRLPAQPLPPLSQSVLAYLARALPASLLLSSLLTLLIVLRQRLRHQDSRQLTRGLSGAPTIKRPAEQRSASRGG